MRQAVEDSDAEHTHAQRQDSERGFWARVLHEPLLHFLLLGAGLFVATRYWSDTTAAPDDNQIVVSEGKVLSLIQIFRRTWQRPPTRQELAGLIQDYVNEEVLYREALAMGLDKDDTLIRRRLRQKLEFVAEDLADAVEPTDDDLVQFLSANQEQYRLEDRTTFMQIFFSPERRGDSLDQDIQDALDVLRNDDSESVVANVGDSTLLPTYNEDLRDSDVASLLGREFIPGLKEVETGVWTGPIESSYGLHLVNIRERTPGRVPNLDEVRDAVRRDWFADRRAQSKQQFYSSLLERYDVVIDTPEVDDPDAEVGQCRRR